MPPVPKPNQASAAWAQLTANRRDSLRHTGGARSRHSYLHFGRPAHYPQSDETPEPLRERRRPAPPRLHEPSRFCWEGECRDRPPDLRVNGQYPVEPLARHGIGFAVEVVGREEHRPARRPGYISPIVAAPQIRRGEDLVSRPVHVSPLQAEDLAGDCPYDRVGDPDVGDHRRRDYHPTSGEAEGQVEASRARRIEQFLPVAQRIPGGHVTEDGVVVPAVGGGFPAEVVLALR